MTDLTTPAEYVVVLGADGAPCGTAEKLDAHRRGLLHKAFSVVVWTTGGEMLLQRRAVAKYHSGGLWSNACCGHPRPGEDAAGAARRRLREEMGFETALTEIGVIRYRAVLPNGLIENEVVTVWGCRWEGAPRPDPAEVEAVRWIEAASLRAEVRTDPGLYTVWFEKYVTESWDLLCRPLFGA